MRRGRRLIDSTSAEQKKTSRINAMRSISTVYNKQTFTRGRMRKARESARGVMQKMYRSWTSLVSSSFSLVLFFFVSPDHACFIIYRVF